VYPTPCAVQAETGPGRAGCKPPATCYSLIIPVYNNESSIDALLESLERMNQCLQGRMQVVFVVDGSQDRSCEQLREGLGTCGFASELVLLSRNFGSFAAIRMGLSIAAGPYFAVMAADLQEPPQLVPEFFRCLSEEPVDIALGVRTGRDDPLLSKTSANLFWSIYRRLVQRDMPPGGIDAFGCNVAVRDALLGLHESNSSLVGQVLWLGFRRKHIPYVRLARCGGVSGWTLRRKLRYMFDSIFSFTDLPLTLLMLVGSLGMAFSALAWAVVLIAWLLGAIGVPGYTPIILTILTAMFSQWLGMGIIGAYLWRTFENTKQRPAFVPMLQQSFPAAVSAGEKEQAA